MFKVSEIAEKLNISKTLVYKKIEKLKPSFKQHIKLVKSVKHISSGGFEIFKNHFETKTVETKAETNRDGELLKLLLSEKDKHIEQLKEKDKSLNHALQLMENSQVLLKQDKDRILMLEYKIEEHETISIDPENEKKGFFNSLFNRN